MTPHPTAGPARTLLDAVTGYLDKHYPHWDLQGSAGAALPEGLRLEMHPNVRLLIAPEAGSDFWWADMRRALRMPVKVDADLPEGGWRLVIVTEDVLAGGKMGA
jgi:hypothetical protein